MSRTTTSNASESLTATIELRGHAFPFRLYTRPLQLGDAGTIRYYWIDGSQFRNLRGGASKANFQSIIGFWMTAMREEKCWHDTDQQVHYLLALCYSAVGRYKAIQSIFRDAYLAPNATRFANKSLPDDIRHRITAVVASRDHDRLQVEVDQTLQRFELPQGLLPLYQSALQSWLQHGMALWRQEGNEGLVKFLDEVDDWLSRFRKRSSPWVRTFINMFAYECKAAFYTCYANAWTGLIPWLREHRQLDQLSERFLRVWHMQTQPIEIPHGQTLGRIVYPTRHAVTISEPDAQGRLVPRTLSMRTEHIGPTHVRDVFSGQVLSLHPLSGFFMKDPALCEVAGRFFSSKAYEQALVLGNAESCREYWDLLGAILTAAHVYRQAWEDHDQRRDVYVNVDAETVQRGHGASLSDAEMLTQFARDHGIRCTSCGSELRLLNYHPAEKDAKEFQADFRCRLCDRTQAVTISKESLLQGLLGDRRNDSDDD